MSNYYDLGTYTRKITTTSDDAQRWFDRGLNWCYGFNHEEAIVCFEKALEHDPACAMAHWGIAYAIGPNYNKPWVAFDEVDKRRSVERAISSTRAALSNAAGVSAVEMALIETLPHRYPEDGDMDDQDPWNDAYANAMRQVHATQRDDLDVCTLFAEALMNRTPWALWDLSTGKVAQGADTLEAMDVLETAFTELDSRGANAHLGPCCTCISTCWKCHLTLSVHKGLPTPCAI